MASNLYGYLTIATLVLALAAAGAVGQTNRCSSSVTALIICRQVAGDPPRNGCLPPPWRGMDSRLY